MTAKPGELAQPGAAPEGRSPYGIAREGGWEWTCDDVEKARLVANAEHHPWGLAQPTPDQAWASRSPIPEELRQALAATVHQLIPEARLKLKLDPSLDWDQLDRWKQGAVLRSAIGRALVEHDLPRIRRTRFTPPLPIKKVSGIT